MSIWRGLISDGMSIKIGETAPAGAETGNADREPVTAILGAGSE